MKQFMYWLGICPFCKGENFNYEPIQFEGDQCYFPRECCKCGAKWEEWYNMDFIWHENLKKWVLDTNQNDNVWNKLWENAIE